jgi:hypothetical protein
MSLQCEDKLLTNFIVLKFFDRLKSNIKKAKMHKCEGFPFINFTLEKISTTFPGIAYNGLEIIKVRSHRCYGEEPWVFNAILRMAPHGLACHPSLLLVP